MNGKYECVVESVNGAQCGNSAESQVNPLIITLKEGDIFRHVREGQHTKSTNPCLKLKCILVCKITHFHQETWRKSTRICKASKRWLKVYIHKYFLKWENKIDLNKGSSCRLNGKKADFGSVYFISWQGTKMCERNLKCQKEVRQHLLKMSSPYKEINWLVLLRQNWIAGNWI